MTIKDLEAEVLRLDPRTRARLAERLLESLEELSEEEITQLWAEEAERRNSDMEQNPGVARPAETVFRDARTRFE